MRSGGSRSQSGLPSAPPPVAATARGENRLPGPALRDACAAERNPDALKAPAERQQPWSEGSELGPASNLGLAKSPGAARGRTRPTAPPTPPPRLAATPDSTDC